MYAISLSRAQDVHWTHKSPRAHKLYTYEISRLRAKVLFSTQGRLQVAQAVQPTYADRYKQFQQINKIFQKKKDSNPFFPLLSPFITSIMARSEQGKSALLSRDWTKKRAGTTAPISLEDLMEK